MLAYSSALAALPPLRCVAYFVATVRLSGWTHVLAITGSISAKIFRSPSCRSAGRNRKPARRSAGRAILVCDNTFLTPVFQKPLALGADAVVHSATKYLCGHHDATAGLVITNRKDIADEVDFYLRTAGSGLSPFDSFLVRRGMETLVLRMERHAANAMRVNAFLRSHPLIEEVLFVGDPNHPQYEISKKQTTGCG